MANRAPAGLIPAPSPRELRTFALTVGGVVVLFGALLAWRGRPSVGAVVAGVGAALLAAGVVVPGRLGPGYRAWMAFALALSRITTPVLMGVIYFGILTPIGLAMRLFGRRALARRRGATTHWVDRPAGARRSDLRRQF